MLKDVNLFCHSSIKIERKKVIYVDPFRIEKDYHDADLIFITHDHYDHFSPDDIMKVKNDNTKIIVPIMIFSDALEMFDKDNIYTVKPDEVYEIDGINFETVKSYNNEKSYHPKNANWVGYILILDNVRYFITGDTDKNIDNEKVVCDVLFLPIGGVYTMDYVEGAELTNIIKPKIVVPTHYGCIVGKKTDAEKFSELVDDSIKCEILIK